MLRITAVSYLNTRPFLEGLEKVFSINNPYSLQLEVPSVCAEAFKNEQADIALVPVGALSELKSFEVLPRFCIGANGKVDSVLICSLSPIEECEILLKDFHSRTSNRLAEILIHFFWKLNIKIFPPVPDAYLKPEKKHAYVVIGDKAVTAAQQFPYVYDLAEIWKQFTGLPFVFAVWVFNPEKVSTKQQEGLLECFDYGLKHLETVAQSWGPVYGLTPEAALAYFKEAIDYDLDALKRKAIEQFHQYLRQISL